MVTQNHAVNIKIGIEQHIKQIQQSLPKTFEAHGYDPATAKSMASNVFQTYASAHQLGAIMGGLEGLKSKKLGPKLTAQAESLGQQAAELFETMERNAPFSYGGIGTVTHTSAVDLATGMVARQQTFSAAQAQLAAARRESFLRVVASYDPATGKAEPQYARYVSPEGTVTALRASTPGEIKSNLKKLRQRRPGFRPDYFDPSMASIEGRLKTFADVSLPESQRAEAMYFAQSEYAQFSGRYSADIDEMSSAAREQRDIARNLNRDVRSAKYKGRLAKLKGAVAAGGARTAGLAGAVTAAEAAATAYDKMMATGREPEARYDLEGKLSELEAGVGATRAPTEERAYSTASRLRHAREADRKLQEALRGPVDLSAPGKRRSVTLDAEQQARYAQAKQDYAAAEAIRAKSDRTVAEDAEANLLAKKANDATRDLIKEVKSNTKEQKDNNKMLADYGRSEAVGMGVVARSIGSRAYGFVGGIAGVSGADFANYMTVGGAKFISGSLQDVTMNKFIQNPTSGTLGGFVGATILNAVTNIAGSFAERGAKIRQEVAQLRTERHLELAQILNPSPVAAAFNTGFKVYKPGDLFSYEDYKAETGVSYKEMVLKASALEGGALVSLPTDTRGSKFTLTPLMAKVATELSRSKVLDRERKFLEGVLNTAMDRFGYGGAVSGSEMLKAASAISAEGIPIQRLARSLYDREISMVGPGGGFRPSLGAGPIRSGVPYQAGVSELAIGAYATAIAKSSGLGMNAVQSAIAMQGMGLSNIGLGVNKLTGGVSSTALSNFAAAIRGGMPVSAASQVMGTALAMNREGMFTDLTSLAAHTRGLSEAGMTPGVIGMAKSNMMQLNRGAYQTLSAPYRGLMNSMAFMYALDKSGGDPGKAMEMALTQDMSDPKFLDYSRAHLGPELLGFGVQAQANLRRSDAAKYMTAQPKEMTFTEGVMEELYKFFPFLSTTKPGEIANKLDIERSKADKSVSEEERAASRQASLDDIAIKLDRIANSLGALVGF